MDCNLLLVDDEPNIPKAIRRALRHEGYHITLAHSGQDALDLFKENSFDVVISDHRMPGMTGAELLTKIKASNPETVRIMLSGQADMDAVVQAVNDGAIYKFLVKPWANDNLRSIVREAAAVAQTQKKAVQNRHAEFCDAIGSIAKPARVLLLEIRNPSVLSFIGAEQEQQFLADLTARCETFTGPLLSPFVRIEDTLLATVTCVVPLDDMGKMAQNITQPYQLGEQMADIRLAAGYADAGEDTPAEWLQRGLVALTATSYAGEITAYSHNIEDDLQERHSLEEDMRCGLVQKEFFLQIQPQVCSQTYKVKGAEALCRWNHPDRGLISPMQFIDLAERNGFIHELGAWVIAESCRTLLTLRRRGLDGIRISMNISPRQFSLPDWTEPLLRFARRHPGETKWVEIEITESTVMDDPSGALKTMQELKDKGFRLALDDFGTGHSSLGLLNELPIDVLKFDRSLIRNVEADERSHTLFSRLVEMTHELGMESIAEGVETAAQVDLCQALGCTLIQGYAFHKPLAIPEFLQLVEGGADERH